MNVNLTPELERFVQEKVASGLHASQSEVVREALRLLIEQERLRELHQQRLQAALAEGLAQAHRGVLLDGETVMNVDIQPGYLHRGFEKSCERGTWAQVFPYADRLNYVSPMLNNVGFALAVEKLLDIEVPERCQYYRVLLGELARITDHFTCNGAGAMELGAFTPSSGCSRSGTGSGTSSRRRPAPG